MRNKKLISRALAGFPRVYKTRYGQAFHGDSLQIMKSIPAESVNLVVTSPPFALRRKKSYGNVGENEYIEWFRPFAAEIHRILTKNGSFVLDLGGSWIKGKPIRSLYHFELLLDLCKSSGLFMLAQEFYWFNPAKMPAPAEWVTIRRIRVKDAVNTIWWLSKSSKPKASNRWVLSEYKEDMNRLFKHGYNQGPRPSEHHISKVWNRDNGGAIPPNIIIKANTRSNDPYLSACKKFGYSPNPARFVDAIPDFFIRFLTRPNDLVLDPFAGSNVVGYIAEQHHRRWISIEIVKDYIIASRFRFEDATKLSAV
jgi:site-specific DNA-methyltransferase (cytosine-N4-specific)